MSEIFNLLRARATLLLGMAFGAAIFVLWLMLVAEREHAENLQRQITASVAAHDLTVARYSAAQASARAAALDQARRAETRLVQEQENARAQIAALDADYRVRIDRFVRGQRAPAIAGSDHSSPDLPGSATLPAGTVPPPGFAIVPVTDLERTAAAFAQLDALIDYVEALGLSLTPAQPNP